MQKHKNLLTILLAVAITAVLAACASVTITPESPKSSLMPGTPKSGVTPALPNSEETQAATAVPTNLLEKTQQLTPTIETTQALPDTTSTPSSDKVDPGRVTNLMDFSVVNQDGKNTGDVEDLIINLQNKQLEYVIVSTVDRKVAVPWQAIKITDNSSDQMDNGQPKNSLVLAVDQGVFDNAPAVQLSDIPGAGEPAGNWDADVRDYWDGILNTQASETPTPEVAATSMPSDQTGLTGVIRASELLSYKIEDEGNLANISVDDVLINVESGEVQYVVINVNSSVTGEMLIPIPLNIFHWDSAAKAFTLNVNANTILNAPIFNEG